MVRASNGVLQHFMDRGINSGLSFYDRITCCSLTNKQEHLKQKRALWVCLGIQILPGQYYDDETGLHYNYFRYYDPGKGRYLRKDPFGFTSGDFNLFAYVQNNAINYFDSLGLAKYNVYYNYESVSLGYPIGMTPYAKVTGMVISMKKSCEGKCKGLYEAVKFESLYLGGIGISSPIGGSYNNQEIFEDNYESPDVTRVEGWSWFVTGTIAVDKWGKSGGCYRFGELRGTNENVSDVKKGYDLGVDYVGGWIRAVGDIFCVESPY